MEHTHSLILYHCVWVGPTIASHTTPSRCCYSAPSHSRGAVTTTISSLWTDKVTYSGPVSCDYHMILRWVEPVSRSVLAHLHSAGVPDFGASVPHIALPTGLTSSSHVTPPTGPTPLHIGLQFMAFDMLVQYQYCYHGY